jgi:hypothetical protein
MSITALSDILRNRKSNLVLQCSVESGGKVKGKVSRLVQDKYGRISGIEILTNEGTSLVIPYEWVDGIDEERKVLLAHFPEKAK